MNKNQLYRYLFIKCSINLQCYVVLVLLDTFHFVLLIQLSALLIFLFRLFYYIFFVEQIHFVFVVLRIHV